METEKKAKKNILGILLSIVLAAATAAFVYCICALDFLPSNLLVPALGAVIVIALLMIIFMLSKKKGLKVTGGIVSVILIIVFAVGSFYMYNTINFLNKLNNSVVTEVYYVVTDAKNPVDEVKKIKDKTISIASQRDEIYDEAKDKLSGVIDVKYEESGSSMDLCKKLIDKKSDYIFLNSAYYDVALDELDGFDDSTVKIVGKVDVSAEKKGSSSKKKITSEPFNIYITGIDTTGYISNVSRSDVNILATVNPKTKKILLTSIPRDYYVTLPSVGEKDKLSYSGLIGREETINIIEDLLDVDIDHYVKVNFTTVESIVDIIGGIDVYSEYAFTSRVNGQYSFVEGMNHLNGEQTLSFVRERKSFNDGDKQRIINEQNVLMAIFDKVMSDKSVLTKYTDILDAVEYNIDTDLTPKEISSLVKMQLKDMSRWKISRTSLDGEGMKTHGYFLPYMEIYVMMPDYPSVAKAKDMIESTMLDEFKN